MLAITKLHEETKIKREAAEAKAAEKPANPST
jgi:hypothetical protein